MTRVMGGMTRQQDDAKAATNEQATRPAGQATARSRV
jgi:hypothetical protein